MLDKICNVPCLLFPTIVKMNSDKAEKEAQTGRQFELSVLMFKVDGCSCCGITQQPHHIDPFYPKDSPLPKNHLNAKFYDAWGCNCFHSYQCQQFYGANLGTIMADFKLLHNNVSPGDAFICGVAGAAPNAKLCHGCCFSTRNVMMGKSVMVSIFISTLYPHSSGWMFPLIFLYYLQFF
jgi:hypothetical protein